MYVYINNHGARNTPEDTASQWHKNQLFVEILSFCKTRVRIRHGNRPAFFFFAMLDLMMDAQSCFCHYSNKRHIFKTIQSFFFEKVIILLSQVIKQGFQSSRVTKQLPREESFLRFWLVFDQT